MSRFADDAPMVFRGKSEGDCRGVREGGGGGMRNSSRRIYPQGKGICELIALIVEKPED